MLNTLLYIAVGLGFIGFVLGIVAFFAWVSSKSFAKIVFTIVLGVMIIFASYLLGGIIIEAFR